MVHPSESSEIFHVLFVTFLKERDVCIRDLFWSKIALFRIRTPVDSIWVCLRNNRLPELLAQG